MGNVSGAQQVTFEQLLGNYTMKNRKDRSSTNYSFVDAELFSADGNQRVGCYSEFRDGNNSKRSICLDDMHYWDYDCDGTIDCCYKKGPDGCFITCDIQGNPLPPRNEPIDEDLLGLNFKE